MIGKKISVFLLLFVIGVAGCEQPGAAGKGQSAQDAKKTSHKTPTMTFGDETVSGVSRTPDMPAYHWPADFKLPLDITMEAPDVPKEIQGPSPPIVEENKEDKK